MDAKKAELFYVGYRELFEKPHRLGYTKDITEAGKFDFFEARSMTVNPCSDGYARWYIACSALNSFKEGRLCPKDIY